MKKTALILFIVLFSTSLNAQVGSVAFPSLEMDRGSLASSLSGASILTQEQKNHIIASYQYSGINAYNYANIEGEFGLIKRKDNQLGKLQLSGIFSYGLGDTIQFTSSQNTSQTVNPTELFACIGANYSFTQTIGLQAQFKYISENIYDISHSAIALDLLFRGTSLKFKFAAGIQNVGTKVQSYSLPSAAIVAFAFDNGPEERDRIFFEADLKYYFCKSLGLNLGLGYTWGQMISIRAGYHHGGVVANHFSTGLALAFGSFQIDASCQLYNSLKTNSFCIGLGYSFGE